MGHPVHEMGLHMELWDITVGKWIFITGSFEDDDITHVEGDVNPVRDLDIIFDELRLKDLEYLSGARTKLERNRSVTDKAVKFELVGSLGICACYSGAVETVRK